MTPKYELGDKVWTVSNGGYAIKEEEIQGCKLVPEHSYWGGPVGTEESIHYLVGGERKQLSRLATEQQCKDHVINSCLRQLKELGFKGEIT